MNPLRAYVTGVRYGRRQRTRRHEPVTWCTLHGVVLRGAVRVGALTIPDTGPTIPDTGLLQVC